MNGRYSLDRHGKPSLNPVRGRTAGAPTSGRTVEALLARYSGGWAGTVTFARLGSLYAKSRWSGENQH